MPTFLRRGSRICLVYSFAFLMALPLFAQSASVSAPAEVKAGAEFSVTWTGPNESGDFLSLDPPGSEERRYGTYVYTKEGSPLTFRAPGKPGPWTVRYHRGESGYPVLAEAKIQVIASTATIKVQAEVAVAETLSIEWTGPDNPSDFISVDRQGATERQYGNYAYTTEGSPLELRMPGEPGSYEIRYHLGVSGYPVIGKAPITVKAVEATLDFQEQIDAGSPLAITWEGPNNPSDFISIDEAGAESRSYGRYAYTKEGSPLEIPAPDVEGTYEVRYHLGTSGYPVIGSKKLTVGGVTATLTVEGPAVADEPFEVAWTGPNNEYDFITVVPVGTPAKEYANYAYTRRGSPLRVLAPKETGPHEIRYLTGQARVNLASVPIEVVAGQAKGLLRVFLSNSGSNSGTPGSGVAAAGAGAPGAVEVILDASGSMLQKLEGTRRIELARAALLDLTGDALPAGVPFALRVFGHRESDSCRTDLEIPLGPLDRARAAQTLRSVNAMNLAKTPIADSLRRVKTDLEGAEGSRLVILVTDGEETCGGDPAAVIEELRASGIDVRVNIVGFAIDELMVKEEFERWAQLGGGRYFDASDGETLRGAVRGALATTFELVRNGEVVASGSLGGDPLELEPGDYSVRVEGRSVGVATVVAKEQTDFIVEN